ncbi:TPA: hypothetical protein I9563_000923, partial [Clostridioides difficile]|nr:hypothetical protein [Clostridioides difficile]
MDKYNLIKLYNMPYDYLIIAKTFENPIHDIEKVLHLLELSKGVVLFDLTLINGNKSNQYISAKISDNFFERNGFEKVDNIPISIKKLSLNYFKNNQELVNNSILPKA